MKLLRQSSPDPQQLALQLDLFAAATTPASVPMASAAPAAPTAPATPFAPPPVVSNSASSVPTPGKRRIQLGSHLLEYTLVRSKRRTIGFLIGDEGLRMTAPKWVSIAEIEGAIHEKQRWIFAKLNQRRERSARRLQPQMQWRDGATLPYLGADITLRIASGRSAGIEFLEASRELTVCLPADAGEQQLKDRVQGWLQGEARRIFTERLPLYAARLEVAYRAFSLSSATTQWGSCTADGRIRLNWRLVHFTLPLIDYVIAHELSHLREMNHSPRFWATVQSIFPEFQSARKALRDHAPETLPVF
ncbi:M48 family metallopeptidase [Noviherbaspirillum sedimenti]|uniref:M48 family peptidase n=1 Tax=Noviherbaspirillum sedimenti TaxID=2320865 RepID=A0A3A3G6H9_9BURK|nr:SprT family zinc-dependent metalloprotease [Noviherbaspirillum sedimenti]RJG02142.1 M48 family peptidase [Noviherbaspirillum sedimenti]